jgi:4-hydroxy-tetrahydrodipicolinate synthase
MKTFGRVLTAMVTPFNDDLTVNHKAAAELANYLVDHGNDGLVVAGSTGEAATMSADEKLKLFSTVLDAVGDRATVVAGTGSNDTLASIAMTRSAEKLGVHGAMLVGPYYNKPPQEGFYQHFSMIAKETDLPILLYNVPGRTASNILAPTVARLSEIPNIIAIKEACGNLEQVADVVRLSKPGFLVYSGDDSLTLPILSVGGCGIISVAGHIVAEQMQKMIAAFFAGDVKKATEIHLELLPFFKVIFITTNPIPIKTAVNLIGQNGGPLRPPMVPPTAAEIEQIRTVMHKLGYKV